MASRVGKAQRARPSAAVGRLRYARPTDC